jgi:hypothetical protein
MEFITPPVEKDDDDDEDDDDHNNNYVYDPEYDFYGANNNYVDDANDYDYDDSRYHQRSDDEDNYEYSHI